MSGVTQHTRRLVKVQEFIDFLIAKKVKSVCLSCGNEEGFVSADEDPLYAAQTKSEIAEFNPQTMEIKHDSASVVLAISVICGNCGYIRSYASHAVYEWLEQRAKNGQAENE